MAFIAPLASTALQMAVGAGLFQAMRALRPQPPNPPLWSMCLPSAKLGLAAAMFGAASLGVLVCRGKRRVFIKPISQESLVTGSQELVQREPDCQVSVAYINPQGNLDVVGAGIRMKVGEHSLLLTASHNLAYSTDLWLIKGSNQVRVGQVEVIPLAADASIVEVPERVFSTLGVKIAQLGPLPGKSTMVSISGVSGKGTVGQLHEVVNDYAGMGHVEYRGTTMGGYSGAPYASGRTVYGMHVHGGARNGGYEILYLYAAAKVELEVYDEDTEDVYLARLFASRDADYYVQFKGRKAIVRVGAGRHYHVVDRQKFENAEYEWEHRDDDPYDDEEYVEECAAQPMSVSLNFQRPGHESRAGNMSANSSQHQQSASSSGPTNASSKRSTRARNLRRSRQRLTARRRSAPPAPRPVTSGTPSESTQRTESSR